MYENKCIAFRFCVCKGRHFLPNSQIFEPFFSKKVKLWGVQASLFIVHYSLFISEALRAASPLREDRQRAPCDSKGRNTQLRPSYQLACDLRHICGRSIGWLDQVILYYDSFPLEEKRG